jgi:hypothetical protein
MKFLAQDATFNLPQIADIKNDTADVSLACGNAIYPHEEKEYKPFMARQGPGNDVSTLSSFIRFLLLHLLRFHRTDIYVLKSQGCEASISQEIQKSFEVRCCIGAMSSTLHYSLLRGSYRR